MDFRRILKVCLFLFLGSVLSFSCKKKDTSLSEDKEQTPQEEVLPPGTHLELALDSLYLLAKQTYLWYNLLPEYEEFKPRSYAEEGDDLGSLQKELEDITSYAINPKTGRSYEFKPGLEGPAFSYITDEDFDTHRRASVNVNGEGDDLGLYLSMVQGFFLFVRYVEKGSPADKAGLKRGMEISGIDGVSSLRNGSAIEEALSGDHLGLTVRAKDGQESHVTLDREAYISSPVLKHTIIEEGGEKIGYLALARFSVPDIAHQDLDKAFDDFAGAQIKDLVVDLRYNGGGYVAAAEELANRIAPASIAGEEMYAEHFNDLMQKNKATILRSIPYYDRDGSRAYTSGGRPATYADIDYSIEGNTHHFSKIGSLNSVENIVFIVSSLTASASELLINALKPYVNVKLVGGTTFGKPVGTFGIDLDKYTLFLTQMEIYNAEGKSDYFRGLSVDMPGYDDVTHDFGDPEELNLSIALDYLVSGDQPTGRKRKKEAEKTLQVEHFNLGPDYGLIEDRATLK